MWVEIEWVFGEFVDLQIGIGMYRKEATAVVKAVEDWVVKDRRPQQDRNPHNP